MEDFIMIAQVLILPASDEPLLGLGQAVPRHLQHLQHRPRHYSFTNNHQYNVYMDPDRDLNSTNRNFFL